MNTNTQTLSADQVKEKILNSKGSFVKVSWKSNPTPAAAYKKDVVLEKQTTGVVRAGINYANLSAVKQGIEDGDRGPVEELPWGQWKTFPYIIEHKDVEYIRLYPSEGNNHRCISTFFVNGEEVDKEDFAKYLTPSESKKLLEPTEADKPLCFTIKADNLLGIPEDVEEVVEEKVDNKDKVKALFEQSSSSETYYTLDYDDLDSMVNLFFLGDENPKDGFECVAYGEWSNDSSYDFTVAKTGYWSKYEDENIEKAFKGDFKYIGVYTLLNYMCRQDVIPEGKYLINVSW